MRLWERPLNQCDGCAAGFPVVDGLHRVPYPSGVMSCQAHRYSTSELTSQLRESLGEPSLLTLERNDVAGAMTVARALKASGRLDPGALEMLVMLQDDPTELEAALAAEVTP